MKNKNEVKREKQIKLAEILFESGMELPVIEKITGVYGVEILARRIQLDEKNSNRK